MITALIIDDEASVRNGMLKHIRWKQLGVDRVHTADSAEEAVKFLEHTLPDLIISDIRLPKMDGTELARLIRERKLPSRIIFISAYSDLEYYRSAIRLNVEAYIEKPIHMGQMEETIKKTVVRIMSESRRKEEQLLARSIMESNRELLCQQAVKQLLKGKWNESLMENLRQSGIGISPKDLFQCVLIRTRAEAQRSESMEIKDRIGEYFREIRHLAMRHVSQTEILLLAFTQDEWLSRVHDLLETFQRDFLADVFPGADLFIVMGERAAGYEAIPSAYTGTVCQMQEFFFLGYHHLIRAGREPGEAASVGRLPIAGFQQAVVTRDEEKTLAVAEEILMALKDKTGTLPDVIRHVYFRLNAFLMERIDHISPPLAFPDEEWEDQNYSWIRLSRLETLQDCHLCLLENIRLYYGGEENAVYDNQNIGKMIRFIRSNFSNSALSVKDVADAAGLTPQYVAAIFREKTGITIGQYMKNCRLKYSEELLCRSDLTLGEIAARAGYADENYWAKVFRKKYQLTPSEYRKRYSQL